MAPCAGVSLASPPRFPEPLLWQKRMKKLICLLLTLNLTLFLLLESYAQDVDVDPLSASDVNADGSVNILDLTQVANLLGKAFVENLHSNLDVNRDGNLNVLDLVLIARHFGKKSGIPFEVTDDTFDDVVLGSELPIVVEFKDDT